MNWKVLVLSLPLMLACWVQLQAQEEKIGFANVELILSYMPEAEGVAKKIQAYQKKKGGDLQIKEQYAQTKVGEYQEMAQGGATEQQLKPLEDEIRKLDQEIKNFASKTEQEMMQMRGQLLEPVLEKLQEAIKKVAEEKGYTFILNTVDSQALSIVLHGPEDDDITLAVMAALGIEIPEGEE